MEENKQLILVGKVENQLRKKRTETVFPLSPTHRKELRRLRDENIGQLRTQARYIKNQKIDEYQKKYSQQIVKELEKQKIVCQELNKDWDEVITIIYNLLEKRKKLEAEKKLDHITIDTTYTTSNMMGYLEIEKFKKEYSNKALLYEEEVARKICNEEFEENIGEKFKQLDKQIDLMNKAYEEAINFGDLEIVKELYYKLKDADQFLEKLRNMKI